jgi:hypothetical protein
VIANINADMVGEGTVKTNSRFYSTRTPDSAPSFLDGLMSDVLQRTREANLYAPTGTHNYWTAEPIAYAQGSDHDIFLGVAIPATMLGHDPDWTRPMYATPFRIPETFHGRPPSLYKAVVLMFQAICDCRISSERSRGVSPRHPTLSNVLSRTTWVAIRSRRSAALSWLRKCSLYAYGSAAMLSSANKDGSRCNRLAWATLSFNDDHRKDRRS